MGESPIWPQALRLARRELRGGIRGFGVFLACLFLGVFAISGIGSFTAAAREGILSDARSILGGDLEVRLVHRAATREQEAFLADRGEVSEIIRLRTMAADAEGLQRTLVELKAVGENYPLYGDLVRNPSLPLAQTFAEKDGHFGALVEESLLQRLRMEPGDLLRVGNGIFQVRGVITREPDRTVRAFNLGPRVMVSHEGLAATGLVQPGSLVTYAYRLKLPQGLGAEGIKTELESAFPEAGWQIRTWRQAAPRVRDFIDRLGLNLTLIGLCALLVGGLGVSGAVRGYLGGKVLHIAAMKCLGATGRHIFAAYLLQILLLGAIGSGLGLAAGAALPYLGDFLAGDLLPFPLQPSLFPGVLITAALFGLIIAVLFSLKPLGLACRIPPAVLFRGYGGGSEDKPGSGIRAGIFLLALLLAGLAVATSADRRLALWFILGAAGCFALFRLAAELLIRGARRLPRPPDPRLRLGLSNIHRRGSPAAGALFSLGLGLTALVIIALVQANLQDLVRETVPGEAPAYFFLDIQPDQVAAFEETVQSLPEVTGMERYPTLRGRITAIDGVPVEQASISPDVRWAVRGDRYLSYAARKPSDVSLTAGGWWPEDYQGAPLVSLTADLAEGFGVDVGDTLTVNVLGRDITAEIASLREVDWSTLDLNFAILFAPGILEAAPQTHIATVYVPPSAEEKVFRAVTGRFPNISAIGTREVLANVSRTLERIGQAFNGMGLVALLTGFLVLAGAVSADQHRRIRDAVIFKVCGATRRDILSTFALEFLLLGASAGLVSAAVGSLAAFGILEGLMDTEFTLHPGVVLLTVGAGIGLTLLLGLAGTWKALGQKPAPYLRIE